MNNKPRILVLQMGGNAPLDPGPTFVDKTLAATFEPRSLKPPDFIGIVDFRHLFVGTESVDFDPDDWQKLAHEIVVAYKEYDGFVVWHGVGNLEFTASALSFLLENLSKPVVVSGPNHSLFSWLVNANLHSAIRIASHSNSAFSQVLVCFGSVVLQANRTIQVSASGEDMYASRAYPPIAILRNGGVFIETRAVRPLQSSSDRMPSVNPMKWANIFDIHASTPPNVYWKLIKKEKESIESIVLDASDRCPSYLAKNWGPLLREAERNGIFTVIYRPDPFPHLLAEELAQNEIFACHCLTKPALLTKLAMLRGTGLPCAEMQKLFNYDFCGELDNATGYVRDLWTLRMHPSQPIELVKEIDSELLTYLSRHPQKMYSLHPRGFEDLVAKIFRHHGYKVTLTQETRDGGFDFRGILVDGLGTPFLTCVETKRYAKDRPVGVSVVRGIYGIIAAKGASRGVIVTTSRFTRDAKAFQQTVSDILTLYDYNDLTRWLGELP